MTSTVQVHTHYAGAYCVVFKHPDHYIDARKDARVPGYSFIDVVRNGQVYYRESVRNEEAPETILRLIREELTYNN